MRRAGGIEGYIELMGCPVSDEQRGLCRAVGLAAKTNLALTQWQPAGSSPWTTREPDLPIESAARSAGLDLSRLSGSGQDQALREARRRAAVTLRSMGYRLRSIAQALGRKEPAISRLLRRSREGQQGQECKV